MNVKEIKDLINLMNENGLSELEVERDDMKIRLRKGPGGSVEHHGGEATAARQAPAAPEEKPLPEKKQTIEVTSPMVGTFYRAPSPDAPPYVNIGDVIEPGQVICIIEAMKLMNEIKAEVKGKIVDVPAENADPVEFGQALFVLEPV